MRAIVSGQAGIAVMLDGDRAVSIDVENSCPVVREADEWPYLLEDADDAYELSDVSEEQVISELDLAWRKDRSLHFVLILLDQATEKETRKQSAAFLEEFLADGQVQRHIVNRLHVAPLPATADVRGATSIVQNRHPRISKTLRAITEGQAAIATVREAWELLPPDLFGGSLRKESFGFKAVERGLFAAISGNRDINPSEFSREDVEVIRRWRREVKSLGDSAKARQIEIRNEHNTPRNTEFARRRANYGAVAMGAAACALLAVVLMAVFKAQPVQASSIVRLGVSQPGFQLVEAPLSGLQRELYGRTLLPYRLRSQSKKTAERLFVSGEVAASAGRLENAAMAFHESNAAFPTIAARLNEAAVLLNSSKLAQAERLLKSALPEADRPGNELLKAGILTNLGHVYRTQGRFDDADLAYSGALAIDRDSRYGAGVAADLDNLALVLSGRGENVKGLDGFIQALSIAESAGANAVAADSRLNFALTLAVFGRNREAEQNFKSVASYYAGYDSPLSQAYYNFAYGQYLYGFDITARFYGRRAPQEIDQMLLYSKRSVDLYESVSNKSGQAIALLAVGAALQAKGEFGDALDRYNKALTLAEEIGDVPEQEGAWREIGSWYFEMKQYDLAVRNFERALGIARLIGNFGGQCVALEWLSQIMGLTKRSEESLRYINEAVRLADASGDAFMQAAAYDGFGFVLYKLFHDNSAALAALEHASDLYSQVDSPLGDGTRLLIDSIKKNAAQ